MKQLLGFCAVSVAAFMSGCSDPEPAATSAEIAEAQARLLQRTDPVGQFPAVTRDEIIPALEGLSVRAVGDVAGAVNAIQIFDRAGRALSLTEGATLDEGGAELRVALETLLRRKQVELFPSMRQAYAASMSDSVSGVQTNFRAVGNRNKTLRVASPSFGSRDVVMQAHQMVMGQAARFRFSRAEYVYSLTGDYDYLTVNGRADEEID